jgi:hypothetical protein
VCRVVISYLVKLGASYSVPTMLVFGANINLDIRDIY